jgi:predicted metal-dependent phosphoesterase TrpH
MMLKFQRTKLVDVVNLDGASIAVHGVLNDHIFGLDVDVVIAIDTQVIESIKGHWHREETPECSRAIPFLQDAVGFAIDDAALNQRINKSVGRRACPHFANLLVECCDAAKEAILVIKWEQAQADQPDLTFEQFLDGDLGTRAAPHQPADITVEHTPPDQNQHATTATTPSTTDGFIIDLHTHSFPASQCAAIRVDQLIQEAQRIGLDAICLTDHNHVWTPAQIQDLRQKHGFLVLNGNEITTDQGDMLVFGLTEDIQGIIPLQDLKQRVDACGGYIIAAHPFRGFLVFDTSQIGMTVQKAIEKPVYQQVHALEVLNGKVTVKENRFASDVAQGLGLPGTGGSDAHDLEDIGKYATRFDATISNDQDLLAALHSGGYRPIAFRS